MTAAITTRSTASSAVHSANVDGLVTLKCDRSKDIRAVCSWRAGASHRRVLHGAQMAPQCAGSPLPGKLSYSALVAPATTHTMKSFCESRDSQPNASQNSRKLRQGGLKASKSPGEVTDRPRKLKAGKAHSTKKIVAVRFLAVHGTK